MKKLVEKKHISFVLEWCKHPFRSIYRNVIIMTFKWNIFPFYKFKTVKQRTTINNTVFSNDYKLFETIFETINMLNLLNQIHDRITRFNCSKMSYSHFMINKKLSSLSDFHSIAPQTHVEGL